MFWLKDEYDPNDPLNAPRGFVNSLILSALLWGIIAIIYGIIKYA